MLCKDNANREQNNKLAWLFCRDAAYLMQRYNIFFDTPNFYSAFLPFAEKNNDKTIVIYRQVDFSLSTSRFAAIDKSILRNFKMQVKLIYGHFAHFAHFAHIVL